MKKFPLFLVLGGLLLSSVEIGSVAHADEKSGTTEVTASFTKPKMIIPTEPDGHNKADTPATENSELALLYVPKSFKFIHEVKVNELSDLSIALSSSGDATTNQVGIADVRGNGKGWKLTARLSELKDSSQGDKILQGASLVLGQSKLRSFNPVANTKTTSFTEVQQNDYNQGQNPSVKTTPVELSGVDQEVATASVGKGAGYWDVDLSAISLKVPNSADNKVTVGNYSGSVTWTLSDAPN